MEGVASHAVVFRGVVLPSSLEGATGDTMGRGEGEGDAATVVDTLLFFYKNLFYKNVEAEIYQNFKNMLRTYPRL